MKRKFIFFDIDGTLTVKETGKPVKSAIEACRKLEEAGHFVALCTGRAFYKSVGFAQKNGFKNMVCNGGHGIYIDGKLVENGPIDYEKSLALYREFRKKGYGVLCAMDDSTKVYAEDFSFYDQCGPRREETVYIIDENFDPADWDAIYKLYVSIKPEEEKNIELFDTVGHMRFVPEYVMYQHDDKKRGIMKVLEMLDGKPEDVVVFGDDENDFAMFDEEFFCVAMGNGNDKLKAGADYVCEDNTDDGIYKTCEKFGWF